MLVERVNLNLLRRIFFLPITTANKAVIFSVFFFSSSLLPSPTAHAFTNSWWATPGQKFFVYKKSWASCSVGFPAWDKLDNKYFITAGHCFRNKNLQYHFSQTGKEGKGLRIFTPDDLENPIGRERIYFTVTKSGTWTDISLVQLFESQRLTSNGFGHIPNVPHDVQAGKNVCLAGYRDTQPRCGKVTRINASTHYNGSSYVETPINYSLYCSYPGDSGGAVYDDDGAVGINIAGPVNNSKCYGIFIPITYVLTKLRAVIPSLQI